MLLFKNISLETDHV